jgi:hypothetical protein
MCYCWQAAFMLMVLRKLGEPLTSPVMQQLYLHLLKNLSTCDMDALSYMAVALRLVILPSVLTASRLFFIVQLCLILQGSARYLYVVCTYGAICLQMK